MVDSEEMEYETEVFSTTLKKDNKAKMNYEFCLRENGEHHELTIQAKEKYKQAHGNVFEDRREHHIDGLMEKLPLHSDPELRAITTREQSMELLSFANFEKARKGLGDDELLVDALAAMKLAKETGGPAARTPKKPEKTGPRCQFCHKEVPHLRCSICKQAFYCDKECQGKDWKKHKKTCKAPGEAK